MPDDSHHWRAHSHDGSVLNEIDEEKGDAGWDDIDQALLHIFELVPQQEGFPHIALCVQNSRPIFFRKRFTRIALSGGFADPISVTCVGFQQTVNGVNVKAFLWVLPDGSIYLTDHTPEFE